LGHHSTPHDLLGDRDDEDGGGHLRTVRLKRPRVPDLPVQRDEPDFASGPDGTQDANERPRRAEEHESAQEASREVTPAGREPLPQKVLVFCPDDGDCAEHHGRPSAERPEEKTPPVPRGKREERTNGCDDDGNRDIGGGDRAHLLPVIRTPSVHRLRRAGAAPPANQVRFGAMARIVPLKSVRTGRSLRLAILAIVVAAVVGIVGCRMATRVDAGHVGIRVKLAGSDRGIQDMPVVTGWVFFNPLTEQIVLFPTSVQNVVWSQSTNEGKPFDESITFSSSEGVNADADVGLSFHIEPNLAPRLYGRFRLNDLSVLSDGYMRNTVREAFNDVTSKLPVQEIYGPGKSGMLNDVTQKCRDVFGKDGIVIDQLTINGALRLPQNVVDAINRAMEATQNAIQSHNRVAQVEAEAQQAVTQAHGQAEAAREKAEGDADALLIRARAEAQANETIRLSMTPAVLQYRALEHWDGKLPTYSAGQLPLLTFDASKMAAPGTAAEEAARQKALDKLLAEETEPRGATGKTGPGPAATPQSNR
jgi:regulator of protease activity HflC (stomatin/prohibitin superfamily)